MLEKISNVVTSWKFLAISAILYLVNFTFTYNEYTWSGSFKTLGLVGLITIVIFGVANLVKVYRESKETNI